MKDKKANKKKIYVSAFVAMLVGAMGLNVARVSAWGPDRPTYTNEAPADHAVFNSITNNQGVGDERNFVRVAEVNTEGGHNDYVNELHIQGGKDYEISIYYHNNASTTYNDATHNYSGVARKTSVSADFPDELAAGEKGQVSAIISSTTTDPAEVWDEAYFIADEKVKLAYISESAKIYNDWSLSGSQISATELFSKDGAYIGVRELNGLIPGCDEFSGAVIFRVKAISVVEPSSTFEMDKKISTDGGVTWMDDAKMNPGDEAEFRITYKNTGNVAQAITAFDTLENGKGMNYVAGSARIVANGTETIVRDEDGGDLFKSGVSVGEIQPNETAEIYYKVKIAEGEEISCGKTLMYNLAGISSSPAANSGMTGGVATQHDKVQVEVNRNDKTCLPSELPSTGPAEIVLAGVIIAGLIVGLFYYVNSKRTLEKMQQAAMGGDSLDKTPEM
ncbi:hypothetical protein IIZ77_01015 [Candidatus Saccharibacteria bacterium]|nr:hypothetical protein [Candidatus Saccharibacteria bacterium]